MCVLSGGCDGCAELVSLSGKSIAASPLQMGGYTTSCVSTVLRALCNTTYQDVCLWSLCVDLEAIMASLSMVAACVSARLSLLFGYF